MPDGKGLLKAASKDGDMAVSLAILMTPDFLRCISSTLAFKTSGVSPTTVLGDGASTSSAPSEDSRWVSIVGIGCLVELAETFCRWARDRSDGLEEEEVLCLGDGRVEEDFEESFVGGAPVDSLTESFIPSETMRATC